MFNKVLHFNNIPGGNLRKVSVMSWNAKIFPTIILHDKCCFFFKWSVIYHKDSTLAGKHRHNIAVVNCTTVNHFKTKKGFLLHNKSDQQHYVI